MSASITLNQQATTLSLNGSLDSQTVASVWATHSQLTNICYIDVAELVRVDSSGLALLTYLCINYDAKLKNVNAQLTTLIDLYDLQKIVLID